jgi:hypothetical protein
MAPKAKPARMMMVEMMDWRWMLGAGMRETKMGEEASDFFSFFAKNGECAEESSVVENIVGLFSADVIVQQEPDAVYFQYQQAI